MLERVGTVRTPFSAHPQTHDRFGQNTSERFAEVPGEQRINDRVECGITVTHPEYHLHQRFGYAGLQWTDFVGLQQVEHFCSSKLFSFFS